MTLRKSNGAPFTVLAAEPRDRTGIAVRVYDQSAPNTLIDVLPDTKDREWLDPLNDGGFGSFRVHVRNAKLVADPTLIDEGRLIRARLHGVDRYTFRVENRELVIVGEGEEAELWWKVSGPGVSESELASAVIYPSAGLTGVIDRKFTPNQQLSPDATVSAGPWTREGGGSALHLSIDEDDPDDADFIQGSLADSGTDVCTIGLSDPPNPPAVFEHVVRYRYSKSAGGGQQIDLKVELLQGAVVIGTWEHFDISKNFKRANQQLTDDQIAAITDYPDLRLRFTGTHANATTNQRRPRVSWARFTVSGPAVTSGRILTTLFDEAQARGALAGMTRDFDDDTDSLNQPWTDAFAMRLRAGMQLIDVARTFAELGVDFRVTPGLVFQMFNFRGVDHSFSTVDASPVVLRRAHNLRAGDVKRSGQISTTLLIETPLGWQEREDSVARATHGRREAYLSAGQADNDDMIGRVGSAALERVANPLRHFTLSPLDASGHRPYVDFDNGDWVLAENEDGDLERMRVRSIAVTETPNGEPLYTCEVNSISEELEDRLQAWLKRMADGTLGGVGAKLAAGTLDPLGEASVDTKIEDHEEEFPHPDELNDLSDVATAGVDTGDALTWDGTQWSPKRAAPAHVVLAEGATWTNMPAAVTEFAGLARHRTKLDLTQTREVRLLVNVATAGAAGAVLRAQYSTDQVAWAALDGASGPEVAIDATGLGVSGWVALEAGAKADVFVRIVGADGDGAADPVFGPVAVQVRN